MTEGAKITPCLAAVAAAKGIRHVVISPGSRSAPLTLAFVRNGAFNCIPVIDERSAGFFAMGIAQQLMEPVILICTSGTATLNLSPAIAEAYYQKIPLIILTADRPEEMIDQQDGQAIRQKAVYRNFILKSYHLKGEIFSDNHCAQVIQEMSEAIAISREQSGPVHLNIAFREPLYDLPETIPDIALLQQQLEDTRKSPAPGISFSACYERILIVISQKLRPDPALDDVLGLLAAQPNVAVVAESLANIAAAAVIRNSNECLAAGKTFALLPDLVITCGGPIVSKRMKQFISGAGSVGHWHVSPDGKPIDTFGKLTKAIASEDVKFFAQLLATLSLNTIDSGYAAAWKKQSDHAYGLLENYLQQVSFSDFSAFHFLFAHLPAGVSLQLGNSTPVRYGQIFSHLQPEGTLVYSNRGTSGIDGVVSTAAGAAYVSEKPVLLFTGDLSFQYDANAFWNDHIHKDFRVVVINNSGGNIFRLIDGPAKSREVETYFETRVAHHFEKLAAHFRVGYMHAADAGSLERQWKEFAGRQGSGPCILEITTDPYTSEKVFKEFYQYLSSNT